MWSYLACAPPAALASCAAARRVQDCESRPPVLLRQHPGLPGRRLSARRRRPCQTTAFCRHSNTRRQSDVQQFWRQDLCRRMPLSLEQSAAQSQTTWAVIRPVQAVTEDIFIRTVKPRRSVNCFQLRRIEIFLLTYLLTYLIRIIIIQMAVILWPGGACSTLLMIRPDIIIDTVTLC